mmetsp:Transcript_33307/g.70017  ORF Transcript_33307/g.70017 Transcript_33307/m.70017 type:complete len:83 (-) Transcript_33307:32-280(-)
MQLQDLPAPWALPHFAYKCSLLVIEVQNVHGTTTFSRVLIRCENEVCEHGNVEDAIAIMALAFSTIEWQRLDRRCIFSLCFI